MESNVPNNNRTDLNDQNPLEAGAFDAKKETPLQRSRMSPMENPLGQYDLTSLPPFAVLAIAIGFFILGNVVFGVIVMLIAQANGLDYSEVITNLSKNVPVGTRNFVRSVLLLNHLFSFILPSIATVWIAYKSNFLKYFKLDKKPTTSLILLCLVWLIVSTPFVQFSYLINQMIPLPKWMLDMENSTGNLLETIITKENSYEIFINIFLIAIIPGIGEELMFRGVVQQQFGRVLKNEHVTVWLAAAFFSAIHMQFQGFLARMLLGALLGYMLIWTRNLWIPIIVHALNNGLQIIGLYVMNIKPDEMEKMNKIEKFSTTQMIFYGIFVFLSIIGIYYIGRILFEKHKKSELEEVYTEGGKINSYWV